MSLRILLVGAVLTVACGAPSSAPTAPSQAASSTTFQGTVAGSTGQTGTLDVTVDAKLSSLRPATFTFAKSILDALMPVVTAQAAAVAATGVLHIAGGATTTLTGAYDPAARTVTLSGGGFSFTGSFGTTGVIGSYTGPGSVSGGFAALNSSAGAVTRYCGTYQDSAPDIKSPGGIYSESGVWNVQVSASGAASGTSTSTQTNNPAFPPGGTGPLTGQVTGSTLTLTSAEGGTATGTISNGSVSGTVGTPSGRGSGTFSGSTGACQ